MHCSFRLLMEYVQLAQDQHQVCVHRIERFGQFRVSRPVTRRYGRFHLLNNCLGVRLERLEPEVEGLTRVGFQWRFPFLQRFWLFLRVFARRFQFRLRDRRQ